MAFELWMEFIIIQANMWYPCEQTTDRATLNGCLIATAGLSEGEETWTKLANDSASSSPDVTHWNAASILAQVLTTGLVSLLKMVATRSILFSLFLNSDSSQVPSEELASLSTPPWPYSCDMVLEPCTMPSVHERDPLPLRNLLIFSLVHVKLCPPIQTGHTELMWPNWRDALAMIPGKGQAPGEGGCI